MKQYPTLMSIACGALLAAGCAEMESREPATATAKLEPRSGSKVQGTVTFTQIGDVVRVTGEITGHTKGSKGFHIHEKGDCSDDKAMNAGGHFNPHKGKHGGPYEPVKHAGDLGNITFTDAGVAKFNFTVGDIAVSSSTADDIVGRAVIVHAQADDLTTDPTGNTGARVACGIIK
jgi:Cu-Zn family superoxide dismutase